MSANKTTDPKTYPAELQVLLEKANQGDLSVLPELKKPLTSTRNYVSSLVTLPATHKLPC
jgi:hypothetical protein